MAKTKEPSQRQLRVGEEIRHMLADVFTRQVLGVEAMNNISVTVTEVDVSPDMRNAIAYVSPLGGVANTEKMIKTLNKHIGLFNHAIAKELTMKFAPKLKFAADNRFEYAARIEELLHKANKE